MIGTRLGPYEIIEEIGTGAMAAVYRAYQPTMDRHVAVKVIDASLLRDEEAIARFQREADVIQRQYAWKALADPFSMQKRHVETLAGTVQPILIEPPAPARLWREIHARPTKLTSEGGWFVPRARRVVPA